MSTESLSHSGERLVRLPRATANDAPSTERMPGGWYWPVKRLLDILAVLVLAIPALIAIALSMLIVRLTSRGPAIYSQVRLGLHGRPFRIFKIRSMYHECERYSGARWSTPGDNRVTPVGRFLRRSHLDELPQLWNILIGDMSLIGPRPERPEFVPTLEAAIPHYRDRLRVRPGVTGLAQVQLPPDTDLHSVRRKLSCDLAYIERLSPWLDFRVLLGTIFYVLRIPGVGCLRLPGPVVAQASIATPPEGVLRPETRTDNKPCRPTPSDHRSSTVA
jgi:lipopolysaccharide/colanic/teichoic acid biosynthesis glycosyltransferase